MKPSPHLLILASAGTGKTYRLTNRFLELLFEGVDPARILATTFTRKAAGEILDRVLERLVCAAADPEALEDLRGALDRPSTTSAECLAMLTGLTRRLDSFQVRTIDSFFVHLVRLFGLDLSLPPDWRIVDEREDAELRAEALQDVLARPLPQDHLEMLRGLHRGSASRRVHELMLEQVNQGRSLFLESASGAWRRIEPTPAPPPELLRAAIEALPTAELPRTKAGKVNKRWANARDKLIDQAGREGWHEILSGKLVGNLAAGIPEFSGSPYPDALLQTLRPIAQRAIYEYLKEVSGRNCATYDLLTSFETEYSRRQHELGGYRFDDLPLALAPRTAAGLPIDERELDMWFRLDGRIDHLLLDEFQDTSPIQWRILRSIAEEICAEGSGERSFFCVGDVKQSIYGFRQAEPRLLAGLSERLPGLVTEEMVASYRSSSVILDTVNKVLREVGQNPVFAEEKFAPYRSAAQGFQERYEDQTAARNLPGAAFVVEAERPADGEARDLPPLRRTVERVRTILAEVPDVQVGILMRERKRIPRLIHSLRRAGVDASGEGGNPLTDSEAVQSYLSLLHFADHPEDTAAACHVASTPFAEHLGTDFAAEDDELRVASRRSVARQLRRRLLEEGLGAVTGSFADLVEADDRWSAWDKHRFLQLLDLAFGFESRLGCRPTAFCDHVRTQRVEAPGGARVRVMTIHAAKGLEFDAVVLPEMHKKLVGQRDRLLSMRPEPDGPIECVSCAPTAELADLAPQLGELYEHATRRAVGESLCTLYVAMTRAARRLELILPWRDPGKSEGTPSAAGLVRHALLGGADSVPDSDGVIWAHSDNASGAAWGRKAPERTESAAGDRPSELRFAATTTSRFLPTRSPSAEEGGARVSAANLLASSRAARRGTLVHRWLEAVHWLEGYELNEIALFEQGRLIEPDDRSLAAASDYLRKALSHDAVRLILSRPGCGAPKGLDLEVRNEHRFSVILPDTRGQEEIWNGSIDRLVLGRRGTEVVWASILDYKTDDISPDQLESRVEHYRPQLEHYRRIVSIQTDLDPTTISATLVFLSCGRTIPV